MNDNKLRRNSHNCKIMKNPKKYISLQSLVIDSSLSLRKKFDEDDILMRISLHIQNVLLSVYLVILLHDQCWITGHESNVHSVHLCSQIHLIIPVFRPVCSSHEKPGLLNLY